MLSFILPAYNEELLIGKTLETLKATAKTCLGDEPFEIIVVNDASTDGTADVARASGARVIDVKKRQIAAVRNAGAKEARGEVLVFVDADTLVPPEVLRATLDALNAGAVGGGSQVWMDGHVPFLNRVFLKLFILVWRPMKLAAGCYVFARRTDFEAVGGFDEAYFASEEIWLSKALKARGKFVVVPHRVITSGRKLRMHSFTRLATLSIQLLWKRHEAWQRREGLDLWYDGKRETTGHQERGERFVSDRDRRRSMR
jgi:glycosyltransferase involved in cell wall biosynthesis